MRVLPLVAVALCALPTLAAGQRQTCNLQYAERINTFGGNTPNRMDFLGGGVRLVCDGGTTIVSDSAVNSQLNSRLEFIGNVRYADTTRTLTSQFLQYLAQDRLIVATNNVVLTDTKTGSTLTGPFLSYYMESETRQQEILQMPQGRPRAVLIRAAQTDTLARDTTTIDANSIEIIGQERFVGRGSVEIHRSDVNAFGGQVVYLEQENRLTLTGLARVESEAYVLRGDTIVALREEDSFRDIDARLGAQLESQDLNVTGRGIHLVLAEGEVERMIAVGDTAQQQPAVARSPDFLLEGDSIDALAPGQKLETVYAFGSAYGRRLTVDTQTIVVAMPDTVPGDSIAGDSTVTRVASTDLPELIRNDWVRGDTIIARFADPPAPAEPADTAAPERVLERLDAMGALNSPASSLYRMLDQKAGGYAVNYLLARHIAVLLEGGEVVSVQADEQVHGVYLRPPGSGRATGTGRRP